MKLVGITTARNEADVIEAFVRYHLQIFDQLIVIDHRSRDETPVILSALAAEGLALEVVSELRPDFPQAELATQCMHRAAREFDADWVAPIDADEFVVAAAGGDAREAIASLDPSQPVRLPWRTYVPRPDDPIGAHLLESIRYRRRDEAAPYFKVLVPGEIAALEQTELNIGNHRISDLSGRRPRKWSGEVAQGLSIAHFAVRSAAQIATKSLLGWPARLASPDGAKGAGPHVKELFDRFRSKLALTPEELMRLALAYPTHEDPDGKPPELVCDPVVPPEGELVIRYAGRVLSPVEALADLSEQLAQTLFEERQKTGSSQRERFWRRLFARSD